MEAGREERRAYAMLSKVGILGDGEVLEVTDWVLMSKVCPPHAWYNLLLYVLEREPSPAGRKNVVRIMNGVVLGERRARSRPFTELVKAGIEAISHACDGAGSNEVRVYLHQCIFQWIQGGIVSAQFLKSLEQAEGTWTFSEGRPTYTHAASDEAPATFDLVRLGQKGPGYDRKLDMSKLVQQGMAAGVKEGWLSIDKHGHYMVHVE